jgi:OPA family glycerol-3-phosphate transporter-like MFS transporter
MEDLSEDDYKTTCTKVSWGSSFGTIVVYLCSPLLITLTGWKSVFVFSAIAGIIMLFIWNKKCADIKGGYKKAVQSQKGSMNNIFTPLMIMIMLAIVLQGMLRDGVTTWMPSYISETYNLSNVISILTGVILPLFSILSFQAATKLYMKKLKNPMLCAGVFFGAGAVSALLLTFVTGKNAALSVLLSALLTGCMHGVNLLLICMIPPFFKKYGNVSTASGVLNSCTYIGSAVSTYGIALLSEKFGWSFTLFSWLLIAALGTLICLMCVKPWSKEHTNND